MTSPNIRRETHENSCYQQDWNARGQLGDVRYCKHGKVQVLADPMYRNMSGPGTWLWHTLTPIWDFKKYRLAKRALENASKGTH